MVEDGLTPPQSHGWSPLACFFYFCIADSYDPSSQRVYSLCHSSMGEVSLWTFQPQHRYHFPRCSWLLVQNMMLMKFFHPELELKFWQEQLCVGSVSAIKIYTHNVHVFFMCTSTCTCMEGTHVYTYLLEWACFCVAVAYILPCSDHWS